MNNCRNPECNIELKEGLNYCNEQCLRRHIDIKKEHPKINNSNNEDKETISEIKDILDIMGVSHSEGYVGGGHISKILDYLRQINNECYEITKNKLVLKVNIQKRYIQEKLDAIEAWKIINVYFDECNIKRWKWIGIKALRNNRE